MGFVLPLGVQGTLGWLATMPLGMRFTSRKKYNTFIGMMIVFFLISTCAALYLLLLSVYYLHCSRDDTAEPMAFNNDGIRWSSLVAIVVLSAAYFVLLISNVLLLWGNGRRAFADVVTRNNLKPRRDLDVFPWLCMFFFIVVPIPSQF